MQGAMVLSMRLRLGNAGHHECPAQRPPAGISGRKALVSQEELAIALARAEQAEHSLAASERALAALRYQAQAGGCELSTVGENSYHCRADAPCGLCRLRHRASQAERELATLRELIHTASGLGWQGASDDCEKAEQALATVTAERDEARDRAERAEVQLAGCGSAALGYVDPPAKKGDYGWSASYGDVLALRAQLAKTERVVEAAMAWRRADLDLDDMHEGRPLLDALADVVDVLDAAQAKDSGGSGRIPGSATREAAHASSSGPEPGPEPAGTTQAVERFLDEWNAGDPGARDAGDALERLAVQIHERAQSRKPFGHISKADERQLDSDSPVGVAATAMGGHEAPAPKLAEAERMRDTLGRRIDEVQAALNECGAGFTGQKESTRIRALRAKFAKTARERDEAMTLAEERRDYARAQNAKLSVACDDLRAQLTAVERERDEARAERDVATKEEDRAKLNLAKAAEQIEALRARLAKTEKVVEAAREDAQHCPHACSPPCPFDRAVARTRAALRALDSPVVAGTDSGGSGAATPEGGHAAPTGGPMPPPEPAGSSQPDPLAALAAVLSLPLTEEDRKRIEGVVSRLRPEQPRGGLLPEPWERRPNLDPEAPATRREVEELMRRVWRRLGEGR